MAENTTTTIQRYSDEYTIGFLDLKKGWNYGEGEPTNSIAVTTGLLVKYVLHEYNTVETFPGVQGDVVITSYKNDKDEIEVSCKQDGTIGILQEIGTISRERKLQGYEIIKYMEEDSGWKKKNGNES